MTIEQAREAYETRPFEPFTLCLADGDRVRVADPELMAFNPLRRTVSVVSPEGRGQVVDLLLVTKIDLGNGSRPRSRRRRG